MKQFNFLNHGSIKNALKLATAFACFALLTQANAGDSPNNNSFNELSDRYNFVSYAGQVLVQSLNDDKTITVSISQDMRLPPPLGEAAPNKIVKLHNNKRNIKSGDNFDVLIPTLDKEPFVVSDWYAAGAIATKLSKELGLKGKGGQIWLSFDTFGSSDYANLNPPPTPAERAAQLAIRSPSVGDVTAHSVYIATKRSEAMRFTLKHMQSGKTWAVYGKTPISKDANAEAQLKSMPAGEYTLTAQNIPKGAAVLDQYNGDKQRAALTAASPVTTFTLHDQGRHIFMHRFDR